VLRNVTAQSTLGATVTKLGWVFQAEKAGDISGVNFAILTVPSSGTISAWLETVDTSTYTPSGTLVSTDASGTLSVSAIGVKTISFTTAPTLSVGSWYAIVLIRDTGTFGVAITAAGVGGLSHPIGCYNNGSWLKSGTLASAVVSLNYTDSTILALGSNACSLEEDRYVLDSGTTPDEVGIKLTMPAKARIVGARIAIDQNIDCNVNLYDADNTVLATALLDKDALTATAGQLMEIIFATPVVVEKDAIVRLAVAPATTGTDAQLGAFVYASEADKLGWIGAMGGSVSGTSRTDTGSWTDTSLTIPAISLVLDRIYLNNVVGYIS